MIKTVLISSALFGACAPFIACACGGDKTVAAATPLTFTMQEYKYKKCLHDSICAEINLRYPVFSGGNAAERLNDSIEIALYMAVNANRELPLQAALDSAAAQLYATMKSNIEEDFAYGMSYTVELNSEVLLQTNKLVSLQMDGYTFSGGAHGYYYTVLNTFDAASAESLRLSELVSDTAALRPLLERAFVENHDEDMPNATLKDLLLDPEQPLPLPLNYCIVPSGIRFMYNPYEVAPYAVGQTDIVLSWELLGKLADKKKWLE